MVRINRGFELTVFLDSKDMALNNVLVRFVRYCKGFFFVLKSFIQFYMLCLKYNKHTTKPTKTNHAHTRIPHITQ